MAATAYTSLVAATLANRAQVYQALASMFVHLDGFNLNLVSITRDANNFVIVTFSNPLPVDQVAHLGLTGP